MYQHVMMITIFIFTAAMLGSVTSVKFQFESPANTDYDLLEYFSSRQDVAGYQGMLTLEQNLFGDHRIYSN